MVWVQKMKSEGMVIGTEKRQSNCKAESERFWEKLNKGSKSLPLLLSYYPFLQSLLYDPKSGVDKLATVTGHNSALLQWTSQTRGAPRWQSSK